MLPWPEVISGNHFPDTIYAAEKTTESIFQKKDGEITKLNKLSKSRKDNAPLLIGKRNHGILIHASNLFRKDKFGGKIKLLY